MQVIPQLTELSRATQAVLEDAIRSLQTGGVIAMPVPSSYNDITTDAAVRDFVGWAWYETLFFASSDWQDKVLSLRFGSAHYYAIVVCLPVCFEIIKSEAVVKTRRERGRQRRCVCVGGGGGGGGGEREKERVCTGETERVCTCERY